MFQHKVLLGTILQKYVNTIYTLLKYIIIGHIFREVFNSDYLMAYIGYTLYLDYPQSICKKNIIHNQSK